MSLQGSFTQNMNEMISSNKTMFYLWQYFIRDAQFNNSVNKWGLDYLAHLDNKYFSNTPLSNWLRFRFREQ